MSVSPLTQFLRRPSFVSNLPTERAQDSAIRKINLELNRLPKGTSFQLSRAFLESINRQKGSKINELAVRLIESSFEKEVADIVSARFPANTPNRPLIIKIIASVRENEPARFLLWIRQLRADDTNLQAAIHLIQRSSDKINIELLSGTVFLFDRLSLEQRN